ncbi:MAG: hypothetical protein O6939_03565, partial [Bacteroidetes bacterium]|nr:hypothetical protein [Bacteroidota bacterium]
MLLCFSGLAQSYKTALKNMEKGSYEKAEGSLLRSLEKDSLNPAIKYVYSLLFTTNGFNRYNLDSSYYFINVAIHDLLLVDPKELSRLEKAEILESTLQNQKTKIQQLAFEVSLSINSLDGYND